MSIATVSKNTNIEHKQKSIRRDVFEFFGKRSKIQMTLKEKDKRRTREIEREIKKKNFEKAMELVVACIEDCKEKDPYTEAHYNHLASSILLKKYGQKIPLPEYRRVRGHLEKCLEAYKSIGGDKRIHLMKGTIHHQIACLDLIAGKPEEGMQECRKGLDVFEKYRFEPMIKEGNRIFKLLELRKKTKEVEDKLSFAGTPFGPPLKHKWKGIPPTKCPVDDKKCPLPDWDHEARKNCPLYECPYET